MATEQQQSQMPPQNPYLAGRMWCSNDQGAIPAALQMGYVVLAIVDVGDCLRYRNMGCFTISSLLPPSSAVVTALNDNYELYLKMYGDYLASPEAEVSEAMILAAMHQKPINFMLYTEYDTDMQFHILDMISGYFARAFGVVFGIFGREDAPAYNIGSPEFISRIADTLYVNGANGKPYITREQYAQMIPPIDPNIPIGCSMPSLRACSILLGSYNYGFNSPEDCMRACLGILNNIRQEAQTGMVNPMIVSPNLTADALQELQNRRTNDFVMEQSAKQAEDKK